MYFTRPQFPQQQQLGLFFPALFEFDFGFMCDLGDGRLASDALIVNLSPNSNPDIYHGLISVQIHVQQNWNIIEVTPNLGTQFTIPKCIYLKSE